MADVSPFQAALLEGRDGFNARFALARHTARHLDAAAFLRHLDEVVGPVVQAVAEIEGTRPP